MDLTGIKPCLISVGIGGWYAAGVERLERSVIFNGFGGDILSWKNEYPPNSFNHTDNPYAFKVFAFQEAFNRGYKVVLFCDASLYAIKDPMPIFDYVNDNGLYFFKSGYPISATATDNLLNYSGLIRENLVDVPEFATGCVGINISNPNGSKFFERWKQMMYDGMFKGSRTHDTNDSAHPLFKFSRQDQSAASIALHELGIKTSGENENWCSYYPSHTDKTIFFIKGL